MNDNIMDPTTAFTAAIKNSAKVANTPLFSTVIDKFLGFKISEWNAQGDVVKKQVFEGYEDAKKKGLAIQYVSAFRSNANLINMGVKAAQYVDTNKQSNIDIDNDVFWGFLEHSKDISSEEMQELIAKIIAGEYNVPGTYLMSTLQTVKMLGKNELELFETISSLVIDKHKIPQSLFNLDDDSKDLMNNIGIDFGSLQTLQSLGLFLPNEMTRSISNLEKANLSVTYFDKELVFIAENENYQKIKTPNFYGLSIAGIQIFNHLSPKYLEEYYTWLKKNYRIPNYKLVEQSI